MQVSPAIPALKLGAIQLLGAMVVDTAAQFEAALAGEETIERALRDTRYADEELSEVVARVAASLLAQTLAV